MSENTASEDESTVTANEQHETVRDRYTEVAADEEDCGSETTTDCCAGTEDRPNAEADESSLTGYCTNDKSSEEWAAEVGYNADDIASAPTEANLGLGCGNPTAIANLDSGQTVLDLGSGGGFDCFLASNEVGDDGTVIGVDMTPAMIETARGNIADSDAENVEFRLGEIEHLPVGDETVDVIISNCVLNLSPNKQQVFDEAYRVLRPGGRLAISDIVLGDQLPVNLRADLDSVAECIGGASPVTELESQLTEAGFEDVRIEPEDETQEFLREWGDDRDLDEYIVSASITGRRPAE
ncbi:arsenite methyltransferase [Natrinema pallidum]|uniref:Arsenite methyltransferase n=1 Tax=Natrinema pallidum DSM 3751 TaxID=1227495 RepID=L9YVP1_9EURY|nr:arsenite methyltransferase [Natrinema pallidum]ELY78194.1 hypothetical protein C487_09199 [Natrinema pallidum DSM 3751]